MSRSKDCPWEVLPICWPRIACAFIISKLCGIYLMEFFLFALFFDTLVFSQKLLIVFIVIVFGLWVNSRFLRLVLLIWFDKWLGICIFWEWIICQIYQFFSSLIWSLYLFLDVWLIASDYIDISIIDWLIFIVSDLLLFDDLYISILYASCLCLSFHQLCLKVLLF